jgi:outer membrane protein TolC
MPEVPLRPLPDGFTPWWRGTVLRPGSRGAVPVPIDLESLLVEALQFSPHVQAVQASVPIRSTALVESAADFDIVSFMESKFVRLSDPVGDTLTTGGPPRLRDSDWHYSAGIRKRTTYGGTAELSQRFGYHDNNSLFLDPTQQGNARLSISFTQPLLNGAGKAYNHSRIVLAELDVPAAQDEVVAELQEHLVDVTESYWDLYLRRTSLLQRQRHCERAREIAQRLEDRLRIDAVQSQVLAAQAAVTTRETDLNRAVMAVRNAESRIRTLVNSPRLLAQTPLELIPAAEPENDSYAVILQDALVTAMSYRPEIDRALVATRSAGVRLAVSEKELLPALNMVLETYVAGLEGRSQVGQAITNQFTTGEPGYTAGLVFEVPLGNRAAQARHNRRQLELQQVTHELRATMDTVSLEVELAHRELCTAHRDILATYRAMAATQSEVDFLQERWLQLPGDDRSASFLLEDLLKAQDRLADAEFGFAEAQCNYMLAAVTMKRAMGTLVSVENPAGPGLLFPPVSRQPPSPPVSNVYRLPPPDPIAVEAQPLPDPILAATPVRTAETRQLPNYR